MSANAFTRLNHSFRRLVQQMDGVILAIALILLTLTFTVPSQASASLRFALSSLWHVASFLLLSIGIAAYATASGADNLIAKAFQGKVAVMIPVAALFGALSPFCSCGVIPIIAALLSMGVPVAGVMAFWLSSPLMDPSMFFLTVGTLGTGFAFAKTFATVFVGLLGGFGTLLLMNTHPAFAAPLKAGVGNGGCGGSKIRKPKAVVWKFWPVAERREKFWMGARKQALFLGKWLAFAFVLESLMMAYVPNEWIGTVAGSDSGLSVVIAALVGAPAYLNGYAALPLIDGLIQQGMNPGAGMAFLIAGGATSIPAMIAVFALARRPVFLAYLGFAFLGAVLSGLAFSAWA
ncbi:MAG: permease [Cyanobacteria bacterium J06554_11]